MRDGCVTNVIPPLTSVTQGSTHINSETNWRHMQGNWIRRSSWGHEIKLILDGI